MHDPLTVAHEIRIPLPWTEEGFLKSERAAGKRRRAYYHLATIWHKDPCRDGTDDSCGWFKRARHGDKEVLDRIVKHFEMDWDRVFIPDAQDHDDDDGPLVPRTYFCGLFKPDGDPNLSVSAIVLNLFFIAAGEYFESDGLSNWKKARRWMQKNLFDILLFAENPTDSLFDNITRKFEIGCGEEHTPRRREERIRNIASCIYGWILRNEQKWWTHPRWHIHHFRIQVLPLQSLWHWLFTRCSKCGKRFRWKESRYGSWSGNDVWHERCQNVDAKPERN